MSADTKLTDEEAAAIRSLDRLARKWPRSLMLASMGGSLYVVPTAAHLLEEQGRGFGMDPDSVLACISGIPNTGGDW